MKKLIVIILTFTFSGVLTSQTLDDATLKSFYTKTFEDYFSNLLDDGELGNFYIKSDSNQTNISTKFDRFEIHFVTEQQANELIKKKKIEDLFWTKENIISKDTVDITIGGWSVEYKRRFFKKGIYYYSAWCGGTMGYIPEGRFIYNYDSEKWKYQSEKEIIDYKIQEYQNKLNE